MTTAIPPSERNWATKPVGRGWISLFEFLVGSAIVVGHNVYSILPNEVPILFVIGWISIHFRDRGWRNVGLNRPCSWRNTILIALAVAAVRVLGGELVVEPSAHRVWHHAVETSAVAGTLHAQKALIWLLVIWTFAAFGEEMSYRGYLLTRAADLGRRSAAAYWIAVIAVSILFGYGHYYKGPTGIVDSTYAGFVLGSAYILSPQSLGVHPRTRVHRYLLGGRSSPGLESLAEFES